MSKILILNGSPRTKGNTAALTSQFKKGAEESGNEATTSFLKSLPCQLHYTNSSKIHRYSISEDNIY
jgi:multimeric flavodoxin WrbA